MSSSPSINSTYNPFQSLSINAMPSFSVAIGSIHAVFLFLSSHITDLMSWCNFAIWSLSFCHSVHLFERPRCYAYVAEPCHFSIWSWSSIKIYIISLSSHQRVARDRPHAIFPLKAIVSHPVCCTPPTPSSITESIRTAYFLTDFESMTVKNTEQKNREISVPFLWYKNALKTYYY